MRFNSLKNYLDENDIVNDIRLSLNSPQGEKKVFVLLEGESDLALFRRIIKSNFIEFKPSYGGKSFVELIIAKLSNLSNKVVGITDADFDNLIQIESKYKNILKTDCHDLEMMLVRCEDIYRDVLLNFVIAEELIIPRSNILNLIQFVSGVKFLNYTKSLNLNQEVSFRPYLDLDNLQFHKQEYLQKVFSASINKEIIFSCGEVDSTIDEVNDPYNLCNGHDFMKALVTVINHINRKFHRSSGHKDTEVTRSFSLLYTFSHFQKSALYKHLFSWLEINNHHEIIRDLS